MTIELRTATRWHDAADFVRDYHIAAGTLTALLDLRAVRAARKDQSIALGTSEWRVRGVVYDTTTVETLPGAGLMRVVARED